MLDNVQSSTKKPDKACFAKMVAQHWASGGMGITQQLSYKCMLYNPKIYNTYEAHIAGQFSMKMISLLTTMIEMKLVLMPMSDEVEVNVVVEPNMKVGE